MWPAHASASDVELVTLKTRVERATADKLAELAARCDRSLAAELRQAIQTHLINAADDAAREELQRRRSDARKDGRK